MLKKWRLNFELSGAVLSLFERYASARGSVAEPVCFFTSSEVFFAGSSSSSNKKVGFQPALWSRSNLDRLGLRSKRPAPGTNKHTVSTVLKNKVKLFYFYLLYFLLFFIYFLKVYRYEVTVPVLKIYVDTWSLQVKNVTYIFFIIQAGRMKNKPTPGQRSSGRGCFVHLPGTVP